MSGLGLGASLTYMNSLDSTISGQDVPGSARALTQLAVTAALPLRATDARLLGSLVFVPPFSSVAQNELGTVGVALTLIYEFKNDAMCPGGVCPPKHSMAMGH
jgi:hypothetical protein